jgi:hypothetical protein
MPIIPMLSPLKMKKEVSLFEGKTSFFIVLLIAE